jgi:hypothetical protein
MTIGTRSVFLSLVLEILFYCSDHDGIPTFLSCTLVLFSSLLHCVTRDLSLQWHIH